MFRFQTPIIIIVIIISLPSYIDTLTLIPLTWRIWWAPNNASKWRMGFKLGV